MDFKRTLLVAALPLAFCLSGLAQAAINIKFAEVHPAGYPPVVAEQEGAALVSGYSKNLVRLFLEADGELTPAAVVADAISGQEYDALEVFD